MFDKDFFDKHQSKLLWLLNTPIVSKWFRYVLRINGDRSDIKNRQITKIEPKAIFWSEGNLTVAFDSTQYTYGSGQATTSYCPRLQITYTSTRIRAPLPMFKP